MTLIDDNPTTTGSEVPDVHAWVARIAELTKPARSPRRAARPTSR